MKNRLLVFLLSLTLPAAGAWSQDEKRQPGIRVIFSGYEENDLVFLVTNGEIFDIHVKGIAYRGQVLYRPLTKDQLIPALTEQEPLIVKFRSNGDYVWSENHMQKFRMAYSIPGSLKRQYAEIHAEKTGINP